MIPAALMSFLRGRLDAVEQAARHCLTGGSSDLRELAEILLREVKAKRRVVDLAAETEFDLDDATGRAHHTDLLTVLKLLAQPYAGDAGFRAEWTVPED